MAPEPPTEPQDAFATLGLTPAVRLSRAVVERAYLARIAAAHPDRGETNASAGDASERLAAILNDAKRTLLAPESRANLVLARLGGPSAEALKDLPDGWLQTIMQTRMAMEEDLAEGDPEALERWRSWAANERRARFERVASILDSATEGDAGALREARIELNAWRYIERLAEQIPGGRTPGGGGALGTPMT